MTIPRYFRDSVSGEYLRVDRHMLRNRRLVKAGALYRAFIVNPVSRDTSFEVVSREYLETVCEAKRKSELPLAVQGLMH